MASPDRVSALYANMYFSFKEIKYFFFLNQEIGVAIVLK